MFSIQSAARLFRAEIDAVSGTDISRAEGDDPGHALVELADSSTGHSAKRTRRGNLRGHGSTVGNHEEQEAATDNGIMASTFSFP